MYIDPHLFWRMLHRPKEYYSDDLDYLNSLKSLMTIPRIGVFRSVIDVYTFGKLNGN